MPLIDKRYQENYKKLLDTYGGDPVTAIQSIVKDSPELYDTLKQAYDKGITDPNLLLGVAAYQKAKPDTLSEYGQEFLGGLKSAGYGGLRDIATITNAFFNSKPGAVTNWLDKKAQENAPTVGSYKDIQGVSDVIAYGAQGLGQISGTLAQMLAGGGLGSLTARAGAKQLAKYTAKKATKDIADNEARNLIKKQLIESYVPKAVDYGRKIGGFGTLTGIESGGIYSSQPEGEKSIPKALVGGTLAASLDVLPYERLLSKIPGGDKLSTGFFNKILSSEKKAAPYDILPKADIRPGIKGLADRASRLSPFAKEFIKEGAKQSVLEGTTEAMQTFVERTFGGQQLLSREAIEDYINSAIIGGIGGGVLGGTIGAVNTQRQEIQPPAKEAARAFPPAQQESPLALESQGVLELPPKPELVPISEPYSGRFEEGISQKIRGPIEQGEDVIVAEGRKQQALSQGTIKALSAGIGTTPTNVMHQAVATEVGKPITSSVFEQRVAKPVENVFKKLQEVDENRLLYTPITTAEATSFVRNLKDTKILEEPLISEGVLTKTKSGYDLGVNVTVRKGKKEVPLSIKSKDFNEAVNKVVQLVNDLDKNPDKYNFKDGITASDFSYTVKATFKDIVTAATENPDKYFKVIGTNKKLNINPAEHTGLIYQALNNGEARAAVNNGVTTVDGVRKAAVSTKIPDIEDLVDYNFGDILLSEAQNGNFNNWSPNTVKHFIAGFDGRSVEDLRTEDELTSALQRAAVLERAAPKDSEVKKAATQYKQQLAKQFENYAGQDLINSLTKLYSKTAKGTKTPENLTFNEIKNVVLPTKNPTKEDIAKGLIRLQYIASKAPELANNPNSAEVYKYLSNNLKASPEQLLSESATKAKEAIAKTSTKVIKEKSSKIKPAIKSLKTEKPNIVKETTDTKTETPKESATKKLVDTKYDYAKDYEEGFKDALPDITTNISQQLSKYKTAQIDTPDGSAVIHRKLDDNKKWQVTILSKEGTPINTIVDRNPSNIIAQVFDYFGKHFTTRPDLPKEVLQGKLPEGYLYEYQLTKRPVGVGAVPVGVVKTTEATKGNYGTVIYDRPLTSKEISQYELKPLRYIPASNSTEKLINDANKRYEELKKKYIEKKEVSAKAEEVKKKQEALKKKLDKIKTKKNETITVAEAIQKPSKEIPKTEVAKNIDSIVKNIRDGIPAKINSILKLTIEPKDSITFGGETYRVYESKRGGKAVAPDKVLYVSDTVTKDGRAKAFILTPVSMEWVGEGSPVSLRNLGTIFSRFSFKPDFSKINDTQHSIERWEKLAKDIEDYIKRMTPSELISVVVGTDLKNVEALDKLTDLSIEDRVHIGARALALSDKMLDTAADLAALKGFNAIKNKEISDYNTIIDMVSKAPSVLDTKPELSHAIEVALNKFVELRNSFPNKEDRAKLAEVFNETYKQYFNKLETDVLPPYDAVATSYDMEQYNVIARDFNKVKDNYGELKSNIDTFKENLLNKVAKTLKNEKLSREEFSKIIDKYLPDLESINKQTGAAKEDAYRLVLYFINAANRKLDLAKNLSTDNVINILKVAMKDTAKIATSTGIASNFDEINYLRLQDIPISPDNVKIALDNDLRKSLDTIVANISKIVSDITKGADVLKIVFTDKITTKQLSMEEFTNALKFGYGFTDEQIKNMNIQDINKEYAKVKGILKFTPMSSDFGATLYVSLAAHNGDINSLYTTVMHEVFHFVERAGLLKDNDVSFLKNSFNLGGGLSWYEHAAEAFGVYVTNNEIIPDSKIKAIFNRIKNFLVKLGNFLKGQGFRSVEDIFRDILSGESLKSDLTAKDEFILKIRNNFNNIKKNRSAVNLSYIQDEKNAEAEQFINQSKVHIEDFLYTRAKIVRTQGIREAMKVLGGDLKKLREYFANALFRGALPKLYQMKFAKEHELLLQALHIPTYSATKAARIVRDIIKDLSPEDYDLFQKILVTRDVIKNVEQGIQKEEDMVEQFAGAYKSLEDVKKHNAALEAKMNSAVAKAIKERNAILQQYLDSMYRKGFFSEKVKAEDYFHRITLLKFRLNNSGIIPYKMKLNFKGFLQTRHSARQMFITDYITSEFEVLSQMISTEEQYNTLSRLQKMHIDKIKLAREAAEMLGISDLYVSGAKRMDSWERLFTDEYRNEFEKRVSNDPEYAKFKELLDMDVYTIADYGIEFPGVFLSKDKYKNLKKMNKEVGPDATIDVNMDDVHLGLGVQKVRKVLLVPKEVADTLSHMFIGQNEEHPVNKFLRKVNTGFKKYLLFNIGNVTKYMLGNMSGDMDKVMAYNPKILGYAPQALKDIIAYTKYTRGGIKDVRPDSKLIDEMEKLVRKGVISAGITASEIPDTVTGMMLDELIATDTNVIKKYMSAVSKFNDIRESMLRLATYRYIKDYLVSYKGSITEAINNLGGVASKKEILENLDDLDDISAKASRDLLGDYANISPLGQYLRTHLIPFWSWLEINLPTYVRLLKNAVKYGYKNNGVIGAATTLGTRLMLMNGMYVAVALWNQLLFPDDADDVLDAANGQLALILTKKEDGTLITLRTPGALSDALAWFGAETLPNDLISWVRGNKDFYRVLAPIFKEAPTAALNKVAQGFMPITKTVFETATGLQLFPDITHPRPLKSRLDPFLRLSGYKYIYDQLAPDRPVRDRTIPGRIFNIGTSLFGYGINPEEVRYYRARELVRDFLVNNKLSSGSYLISDSPRSSAALWFKQSLAFGDYVTAERYLTKYFELGGKLEDLNKSIRNSSPSNAIPVKYRQVFLKSLTPEDRRLFTSANNWYNNVYVRKHKIPSGVYSVMVERARQKARANGILEVKATPYDSSIF